MKKPSRVINLRIEIGRIRQDRGKTTYGKYYAYQNNPNRHLIQLDDRSGLLVMIATFFHEIGHFIVEAFFQSIPLGNEHDYLCDTLERAGKRGVKKILEGK